MKKYIEKFKGEIEINGWLWSLLFLMIALLIEMVHRLIERLT